MKVPAPNEPKCTAWRPLALIRQRSTVATLWPFVRTPDRSLRMIFPPRTVSDVQPLATTPAPRHCSTEQESSSAVACSSSRMPAWAASATSTRSMCSSARPQQSRPSSPLLAIAPPTSVQDAASLATTPLPGDQRMLQFSSRARALPSSSSPWPQWHASWPTWFRSFQRIRFT